MIKLNIIFEIAFKIGCLFVLPQNKKKALQQSHFKRNIFSKKFLRIVLILYSKKIEF